MLTDGIVKRLKSDSDFAELERHIHAVVDTLDTLDGINFSDKEKAAIEGRARVLAKDKLKKILEPFYVPEESTTDKKEEVAGKTGVL